MLDLAKFNSLYLVIFLLFFILDHSQVSTANIKSIKSNLAKYDLIEVKNEGIPTVTKFDKQIIFDTSLKSCDILTIEKVQFNFNTPTDVIHHLIVSKKKQLYGFLVDLPLNSNLSIRKIEIFQDKSLRNRFYHDSGNLGSTASASVNSFYRDRWLISVVLDKKVTRVNLIYKFYTQAAIKVDNVNKKNLLKSYMVNPYPFEIKNLTIELLLLNFEHLKEEDLTIPAFSKLTKVNLNNQLHFGKGFKISIDKILPIHSEFLIQLTLPMEILSCEAGLVNFVYFGLIGMTVGFIIYSFTK